MWLLCSKLLARFVKFWPTAWSSSLMWPWHDVAVKVFESEVEVPCCVICA
jgi:hypothetical protein